MEMNFCLNEKHKKSHFCVTSSKRSIVTFMVVTLIQWRHGSLTSDQLLVRRLVMSLVSMMCATNTVLH